MGSLHYIGWTKWHDCIGENTRTWIEMRRLWLLCIRKPTTNHGSTILIHRCSMTFIYSPYMNHRLLHASWTCSLKFWKPCTCFTRLSPTHRVKRNYLCLGCAWLAMLAPPPISSNPNNWAQNQRTALILNEAALSPLQPVAQAEHNSRIQHEDVSSCRRFWAWCPNYPRTNGYWTSTGMLDIHISNILYIIYIYMIMYIYIL